MCIGGRAGERTATHDRQVGPVVAHRGTLGPVKAQHFQGLLGRRAFFFRAVMHVLDAQGLQAHPQRLGIAPRDDHRNNARPLQQLEPLAIQRVEPLE